MAAEISNRIREIAEDRGLPESKVFEQALERGLETLWKISCSRSISTGPERVPLAAVSDTGPLIHLAEIDSLELLSWPGDRSDSRSLY